MLKKLWNFVKSLCVEPEEEQVTFSSTSTRNASEEQHSQNMKWSKYAASVRKEKQPEAKIEEVVTPKRKDTTTSRDEEIRLWRENNKQLDAFFNRIGGSLQAV